MPSIGIIRDITLKAKNHLQTPEVGIFIGARQAGKTTILRQLQEELAKDGQPNFFLNLEDPEYLALLDASPKNLFQIFSIDLTKRTTVFIDEVQYLKNPSNFLKYFYDEYQGRIKLLVSGSSAFYLDRKFKDSIAGRKKIWQVLTLSFREFLRFRAAAPLAGRDFGKFTLAETEQARLHYQEYLIYGGYPRVVLAQREEKIETLKDIAYSYIKKDVLESNIRQEEIFYRLLKILAAQVGNLVNTSELAATLGVSKTSIDNYLYTMRKSFHLQTIAPFFKNIRKELTKMPKVYFLDLGLRNFLIDNWQPFFSRADQGALLENAVFRQLLENYDASEIRFWRTINKNEIDFVVKEKQAWEVKVNPKQLKMKNYHTFLKTYPEIKFNLASLNVLEPQAADYPIIEAWQI